MNIIITDCDHGNIDEETKVFAAAGMDFRLEQCKTEDDLIARCGDGEYLINQYAPVTRRVMAALPDLKFVVRYGVGVDNIDVEAATELGVQVCNVPDYGMNEVADHALAFFLALSRKLIPMNEQTKKLRWDYRASLPIRRMSNMTVGLYGLGRIGKNFAGKVRVLGCHVVGYDVNDGVFDDTSVAFIEKVSFDELLARADAVLIFAPLETTRGAFDKTALSKMKPSAFLVNTSRGGIVDEEDLDEALKNGTIAAAAFDVMSKEPADPAHPLFQNDHFICTPHMAWYSEESALELKRKAAEEAVSYARERTCRYPVNKPAALR